VAVYEAARKLAIQVGLRSDELKKLPFAIQGFPTIKPNEVASLRTDGLIDAALARRLDRAAALTTIKAKQVMLEKAKRDLTITPTLVGTIGTDINNEKLSTTGGPPVRGTRAPFQSVA